MQASLRTPFGCVIQVDGVGGSLVLHCFSVPPLSNSALHLALFQSLLLLVDAGIIVGSLKPWRWNWLRGIGGW